MIAKSECPRVPLLIGVVLNRRRWFGLLVMLGCGELAQLDPDGGSEATGEPATTTTRGSGSGSDSATTGSASEGADVESGAAESDDGSSGDTGTPVPTDWTPSLIDYGLHCKLISDETLEDPTANATHTRFNLRGTDLGIPLVIGDALHLFFGDTTGYREIWPFGEDPDSVAFTDAAAVAADPSVLCDSLDVYVTPDIPSVAADTDPSVLRDFAAGSMTAPPGEMLSDYIGDTAGPFQQIPGSFEVPSGAMTIGDAVYLTWAGQSELMPRPRMHLSYLVRWDPPRELPSYQIVRPLDAFDQGPLGGHFMQIAPVVRGDVVYAFGTGDFRYSGIYLARIPAEAIESGEGTEVFDPESDAWLDPSALSPADRAAIVPMLESDGVGELSVQWVEGADVYVMLYQRELHGQGGTIEDNRIVLRTSVAPEGPWSDAVTVIDMADPAFREAHCCGPDTCPGQQILHCAVAGLYGAYQLPTPSVSTDGEDLVLDLAFVASTWNPYNVVLFGTRVRLEPSFD